MALKCIHVVLVLCLTSGTLAAQPFRGGLPAPVDGGTGGVLTPAPGLNGPTDDLGGRAFITHARLRDFQFTSIGAGLVVNDRWELSASQPNLGVGSSDDVRQNVFAARVRLLGSARRPLAPAASLGVSYRRQSDFGLEGSLGAAEPRRRDDWDALATVGAGQRLGGDRAVRFHAGARWTRANAGGLFGFGGADGDSRTVQLEGGIHAALSRYVHVGGEYRQQPDYLTDDPGDAWWAAYASYAITPEVQFGAGWMDLGRMAGAPRQDGPFLTLRGGF